MVMDFFFPHATSLCIIYARFMYNDSKMHSEDLELLGSSSLEA